MVELQIVNDARMVMTYLQSLKLVMESNRGVRSRQLEPCMDDILNRPAVWGAIISGKDHIVTIRFRVAIEPDASGAASYRSMPT